MAFIVCTVLGDHETITAAQVSIHTAARSFLADLEGSGASESQGEKVSARSGGQSLPCSIEGPQRRALVRQVNQGAVTEACRGIWPRGRNDRNGDSTRVGEEGCCRE